jgi:hypothetical protein
LLAIVVCLLVFSAPAGVAVARYAMTTKLVARLTARQAMNLRSVKVAGASGEFSGTLLRYGNGRSKLSWTLRYRRMSSPVTKAELVVPAKGKLGAVAVQLCRRCKANAHGVVAPILQSSTKALLTRPAWAVVFTKKNRKGEIRGRIARAS